MTQIRPVGIPIMPVGKELASFENYQDAAACVDTLADAQFAVQHLTIVGTDLKMVERVVGRLTWWRVLATGAISGAMMGLLFSLMLILVIPDTPTMLALVWAVTGGLMGAAAYAVMYWMTQGTRDFSSAGQSVVATKYAVLCTAEQAGEARRILTEKGLIRPAVPARELDLTKPPKYGIRLPDGPAPQGEEPTT